MDDLTVMNDDLIIRYCLDLRKPDIDKFERARLIKYYMKKYRLSQRSFASKIGVPKSTVEDWCLYSRLTKKHYKSLQDKGLSKKDIYKLLRNNKKNPGYDYLNETKLNLELKRLNTIIKKSISNFTKINHNYETVALIKELVNSCNRLLMRLDK